MSENRGSTLDVSAPRELVITRTFDAPRDLVWKACTERDRLQQWWGPRGFVTEVIEMDFQPGGAWRTIMRSPEGKEYPQRGIYREIVPPERLAFTFVWGHTPDREMLCTFSFTEHDGRTEMVFRKGLFTSLSSYDGEMGGWSETFDRFVEYVANA